MREEVTNKTMQSLSLGDGTILAAAGHDGATKFVVGFDADEEGGAEKQIRFERQLKILADSGAISVSEKSPLRAVPAQQKQAPKADEEAARRIAAADDAHQEKK